MKSKKLILGILAGSLMLSPFAASAQPDSGMMKKHMEKMMADLKLTPDQKTRLQALHKQHREEMKSLLDQTKGLREKTKAELLKDAPSKPTLDGFAVQAGELHKQMAVKRQDHLLQMKTILTKEQFEKVVNREGMGPGSFRGDMKNCQHKGKGCCKEGDKAKEHRCPHHGEGGEPGGM